MFDSNQSSGVQQQKQNSRIHTCNLGLKPEGRRPRAVYTYALKIDALVLAKGGI